MLTFRKTRDGIWAVFGPAPEVLPGPCHVHRADGTVRTVTVTTTSRPFDVNGVPHVYGYIEARDSSPRPASPKSGKCAECGRPGATIECSDSSGIPGLCCPRCARMSRYERSFA